jgi:Rps23 Pro-64 3,4-dihydroxylase Tpa1-like proline 4-hydroxylase
MSINYKKFKKKFYNYPKSKVLKIENFLTLKFLNLIKKEIILMQKKNTHKTFYLKGKSNKAEYLDYSKYFKNSKKLIDYLSEKKFLSYLKKNLNIKYKLYPDSSNGFSGFNIVKKNGFLKKHADFNYNSKLRKYRTINLLIYFNNSWTKRNGGNLNLYDYSSNKIKYTFLAKNNRCVIFFTNKYTPHGYKKIMVNKERISLNFYYYTKQNLSYSENPHKTLWW